MEGYIFKKYFTIKSIWDGLPVFTQETIYNVRTEMRQSLDASFNLRLFFMISWFENNNNNNNNNNKKKKKQQQKTTTTTTKTTTTTTTTKNKNKQYGGRLWNRLIKSDEIWNFIHTDIQILTSTTVIILAVKVHRWRKLSYRVDWEYLLVDFCLGWCRYTDHCL